MKTVLFGKKISNYYEVDCKMKQIEDSNGLCKIVYTDKPTIIKKSKVEWIEICRYKGEPRFNSRTDYLCFSNKQVNISEDETVSIEKEIFRADLDEMHLHTDKVVEKRDIDKEDALSILDCQIKAFNKMMIESNDRLKAYCDLHKLSYEDTDCIELFKLVFPDDEYVIENGVMKKSTNLCIFGNVLYTATTVTTVDNPITTKTIATKIESPNNKAYLDICVSKDVDGR